MNIFKLEDYLSLYEFSAPYLLCCSDAESYPMHDILSMADARDNELWSKLRLSYTEAKGHPLLREQIVATLYPRLHPDNILCFAGAEEGIFCALSTLCNSGDHVIVLTPCYQSLLELPQQKGAFVSTIQLKEEEQWRLNINAIQAALKPNTKGIIINFPHNPTGQILTKEEQTALIELCTAHDLWLFSDEVYRLIGPSSAASIPPIAEVYDKGISLGVMSKSFGLAGLRLGWLACQDKVLLKKFEEIKYYTSICNSAPSEILSIIALKNAAAILARNNEIIAGNLKLLDAFFDDFSSIFSWVRPQGGCIGFVHYLRNESIDRFCDRLVKEQGVLLLPASVYDYPKNYFRIGFGRKNMPVALDKLKEYIT